jgi:outer membrane protein assembly factor BamB
MRALFSAGLLLALATPAAAQLANSPWPMFQHDLQHTGRATVSGPQSEPAICWEYRGGKRRAAPSVGADGTVYLTVGRRPMVALDPADGAELWLDPPGMVAVADRSQPAVDQSGVIYMGSRNNSLWTFEPDGDVKWQFHVTTDGDVSTPPTIGPDGTVYMASDSLGAGRLYAITPGATQGTEKWLTVLGAGIKTVSPALSLDAQTLYVTTSGRTLRALDAETGAELWERHVSPHGTGSRANNYSPAVGPDGTIYFAANAGVFAFEPDGDPKWDFQPASGRFGSAPAIGANGLVYANAYSVSGANVYALDAQTGALVWDRPLLTGGKLRNSSPVIGADGDVYVGHSRFLYSIDGTTGVINWYKLLSGSFTAGPIIGGPGLIYAGAGSLLYALSDQGC